MTNESKPRSNDLQRRLYATLIGQGCNIGLTRMARITDAAYHQLAWCNTWYLREETRKAATNILVNFQYQQPLSRHWGGGTLSSPMGNAFRFQARYAMRPPYRATLAMAGA